ncbi:MAG: AsmA family protein [Pseudomonadota bacterium]
MGKLLKTLLLGVAAIVALVVIAVVVVALTFDPNAYKDEITAEVQQATGRSFEIDGDIGLTLFPVLSLEFGAIRLGNAEGFDASEPFVSLDSASASVRVLPALLSREIRMGTVSLQGLAVNLAVNESGVSNWADLADGGDAPAATDTESSSGSSAGIEGFEVGGLDIDSASLVYADAQSGSTYRLTDMNLKSGPAALGKPLTLDGGLAFSADPQGLSGELNLGVTVTLAGESLSVRDLSLSGRVEGATPAPAVFSLSAPSIDADLDAQTSTQGPIEFALGSFSAIAELRPFNYGSGLTPQVELSVPPFSPKTLVSELGLPPIETADPGALERVSFEALYFQNDFFHQLNDLVITVDDTTFEGVAGLPLTDDGYYRLGLSGDSIDLARYMAPATEDAEVADDSEAATAEIPVDLIRAFDTKANFNMQEVLLGGLVFTDIQVVIDSDNGRARIHPITARFFEGQYAGDITIDASTDSVRIAVDENVTDVNLGPMVKSVFDVDNITGAFNGQFRLSGRGEDLDAIRRDLDGTLAIELSDGALLGTDVWYQLRKARATFTLQEPPPEPEELRTEISTLSATGTVTDGVLSNDDFLAQLPFMRVTGGGSVNLPEATVDYRATASILERPEFLDAASEEELAEFTAAEIPLTITGALAAPSIRPDVGKMFENRLRDEAEEKVLERLLGDDVPAEGETVEDVVEDKLKEAVGDRLRDLFNKKDQKDQKDQ